MLLSSKVNSVADATELPLLTLEFDQPLLKKQLRFFRKAVSRQLEQTSRISNKSGNSQAGSKNFYPLIQYQLKAGYPQIIAIGEAVTDIQYSFQDQNSINVQLYEDELVCKLLNAELQTVRLSVGQDMLRYELGNWIALNNENYKVFKKMKDESTKNQFLENKLKVHILAFAKGINWRITERIELKIHKLLDISPVVYRNATVLSFHLKFSCNMHLPDQIGLGKGVSFGFGRLEKV